MGNQNPTIEDGQTTQKIPNGQSESNNRRWTNNAKDLDKWTNNDLQNTTQETKATRTQRRSICSHQKGTDQLKCIYNVFNISHLQRFLFRCVIVE